MVIDDKPTHSTNAPSPIYVTNAGITNDVNLAQFEKDQLAIVRSFEPEANVTDANLEQ
jgi:hypothetical protein